MDVAVWRGNAWWVESVGLKIMGVLNFLQKLEVYRLDFNTLDHTVLWIIELRRVRQESWVNKNHAPAKGPEPNTGTGRKTRST